MLKTTLPLSSRPVATGAALVAVCAALAACSADPSVESVSAAKSGGAGAAPSAASGDPGGSGSSSPVEAVVSFYPIAFATQQIGGSHVAVTSLTKPGAEPHDIELTPQDVATAAKARVVFYAKGFQPAVDEAVAQQAAGTADDLSGSAQLTMANPEQELGESTDPAAALDPHFWLDPVRYASVVRAIDARLEQLDPANAAAYQANTQTLLGKLDALNTSYQQGLASCATKDLVTSHAAFGYLAERYGLTQVPIAGLDPEVEPSAKKLGEIAAFVKDNHVTTIYAETLVEPKFADTIARSTGAKVATLDPIEGLTDQSAGHDYLEVMSSNLQALRGGQRCA